MGWQDAPVVSGGWQSAPVVEDDKPYSLTEGIKKNYNLLKKQIVGPNRVPGVGSLNQDAAHTPDLQDGIGFSRLAQAQMMAPDDDAFAEVLGGMMGKKLLGITKDPNGYPIIEFINNEGKAVKAYANDPGLDFGDVDRAVAQVAAFTPAGKGAALATGARTGLLKGGLAQALGAGATSLTQDAMASQYGSTQGFDFNRAMWSALGAFGGEAASRGLGKVVELFQQRKLFQGGKLTPEGEQLATAYGLDPADLSTQYQKQFAKEMVTAEDPMAAARKVGLQSQDIHPTTGMVTRNNEDLLFEEDIMKRGILDTPSVKRSEMLTDQYKGAQGEEFAKARQTLSEQKLGAPAPTKVELGSGLDDAVNSKYNAAKSAETAEWDKVNPIVPDKLDLDILKYRIKSLALDEPKLYRRLQHLDPQTQSNALAVRDQMEKLVKGKLKSKTSSLYGKAEQIDLDSFRRRLADFRRKSFNAEGGGSDYKAVTDQIDIFNDYLDDMATKGGVTDAVQLQKARDMSKELRQMFNTRGDPAMDPGGRFIRDLIEKNDTSPEAIVDKIFQSKEGLAAYRRLKEVFDPNASELKMMKAYAFEKNFYDARGNLLPPEKAAANVEKLRQTSLYQEMFSSQDQVVLDRFINQTRSLNVPKAVRGKGSAWAQTMSRLRKDSLTRYFLQRRGQSATFQSKPLESFAWQATARTSLASPFAFVKDMQGNRTLRRIQNATIPTKKRKVLPSGLPAVGATVTSSPNYGTE